MNFLILLYFLLFTLLSRLNLKIAVLILIFALPSYLIRFSIFSIPSTLLEMMVLIVSCFFIFNNWKKIFKKSKKEKDTNKTPYPFSWEIILILLISFIAVFVGSLNFSALGIFKAYFLEPIFLFIVILNIFKGEKDIKKIISTLALSALVVSLVAVWQQLTGQFIFNEFWADINNRRVVSFFGYPNAVALYLGPIIPLIVGLFVFNFKEKGGLTLLLNQFLLFVALFFSFLAIYFSKSKGALLALILAFLITGFILLNKKFKLIILGLFIIFSPFLFIYKKDWIELKLSTSLSYQIRVAQWQETMKMLKDGNFIWGAGLSNYQSKIQSYHQEGIFFNKDADPDFARKIIIFDDKYRVERWQPLEIYLYPHNIFLNFWTELGIIGAIVFMFLILKFLFISLKLSRKEKHNKNKYIILGLFSSMLVILIHGIFDVPYFKNDLSIIFWILIALLSTYQLSYKQQKRV